MLEIEYLNKASIVANDQSTKDILQKGFIGELRDDGKVSLSIFEALYLMDVRNANCTSHGKPVSFSELASKNWKSPKFMAKYFTYKDWRDRGLIIKNLDYKHKESSKTAAKAYPSSTLKIPNYKLTGAFFQTDLTTVVETEGEAKEIYETLWFGQYGSYKAADRGKLNKLDIYETLLLIDKGVLTVNNASKIEIIKLATSRRKEFMLLYGVYKNWREHGYVIKTGFKFGTHFRVYFPGAKPIKQGDNDWVHSKHVIHVFPRESKMLISEWARAIRVAHSVRKTFILAVPGNIDAKKMKPDFILYHRRGGDAENPEKDAPKYLMLSLGEEEYLGGAELAGAIKEARESKLELILAIADRETAVTYYKVRTDNSPRKQLRILRN